MSDKNIDDLVKELVKLPDSDLVEKALEYMRENYSKTLNSLVKEACTNYNTGDQIPSDKKTYIAIFVAFEELVRKEMGGKT